VGAYSFWRYILVHEPGFCRISVSVEVFT